MTITKKRARQGGQPEPTAAQAFGRALHDARLKAGMTQAEVAYASGLSLNRVSVIEKGRADARLSSARALARAVGMPLSTLVGQ